MKFEIPILATSFWLRALKLLLVQETWNSESVV